jgi:hypothetical protein
VFEGEKVPDPPVHIPVVTPVTVPAKFTEGLSAHTIMSGPALAVIGALNEVTFIVADVPGQVEESCTVTE